MDTKSQPQEQIRTNLPLYYEQSGDQKSIIYDMYHFLVVVTQILTLYRSVIPIPEQVKMLVFL